MKKTLPIKGFTLLEILVVLIIISISTGVVLLSVDVTGHQKARGFIRDVTFMMQYLSDEAILLGKPHAMQFDYKSRRVIPVVYTGQSWGSVKDVDILSWDQAIKIKLRADGVELEEAEDEEKEESSDGFFGSKFVKQKKELPKILFHTIGMWEPAGELEIIIDSIPHVKIIWTSGGKTTTEYMYQDETF